MYDSFGVDVSECLGYIVAQVYLDVVGQWLLGSLEEVGEAFVHEFHE